MKRTDSNLLHGSRGQSLVEFALILPMILVVMFMITEFGRALYQYNVLETATRMGVRAAVVTNAGNAVATAEAQMDSILIASRIPLNSVTKTVTIEANFGGDPSVTIVRAKATKPFNWAFNGPITMQGNGKAVKKTLTLTAESLMKTETF
jgi:Flp pilus assembly protein TadG